MSQWNNSYSYNNQYQGPNSWNGEMNGQFPNQAYYARTDGGNQYVSFNEFINQMQTNNSATSNTASYSNIQYENYPNQSNQFSYQNVPSTSQTQLNNYNYPHVPSNIPNDVNNYQQNVPSQYNPQTESSSYTSNMILNSNLTPTAIEFVPKSTILQSSTSNQIIPDTTNNVNIAIEPQSNYQKRAGGSSSDKNWRERPQNGQSNGTKEKHVLNEYSHDNGKGNGSNNRNRETYHRNNENNGRHHEKNKNKDTGRDHESVGQEFNSQDLTQNNESSPRSYDNRSRNYDSNSHGHEPNIRNQEPNSSRNHDNSSRSSNNRNFGPNNKQEFNRNQETNSRNSDTNPRNYESNYRNERKNLSKGNARFKGKESENRTFYNSSLGKDQDTYGRDQDARGRDQDTRGRDQYTRGRDIEPRGRDQDTRGRDQDLRGRGEGSGRNRNWIGSQRVRGSDRNNLEDEQFASSYQQQREERIEKERGPRVHNISSPVRFKNKQQGDQVNKEMTQRERLAEQLDKGTLECLVCCDRVKQVDPVWSCSNCYHVLHLRCIRKWAMSSMVEGRWRCPACQNTNDAIPTEYRCMCGAVRSPEYQRGGGGGGSGGAHTCGAACKRARACVHPCTLLCHPGPCPPCQATVTKQCGCGAETRSVLCSSKLPQVCGRVCNRTLECGVHTCTKECHEDPCDACNETVVQVCHCPAGSERVVPCTLETSAVRAWSCGEACGRVLSCGAHVCRATCHVPPCDPCRLLPAAVVTCPCGKIKLDKDARKSCTDPIPLCGNICAKPLQCGPNGDKHFCKLDCHDGPCPVCPDKTLVQCRCGHSSREVPCADLPEMLNNVLCQKKCNKKLSCGRHRCRTACCAASAHRCAVPCGRSLACGLHRCEDFCHTGHCAPCPRVSFSELRCECGAQVLLPPVACGTRPPPCEAPCRRARPCGHPPHHHCHAAECPPCVVLTTKRCYGGHEERKTIPCSQEEFSCGLPCGKPLPCGKHTCIKTCHKGPCDTGKCTQPCMEKRPSCGHPCAAACHSGSEGPCPAPAPCRRPVRAVCPCGRRTAQRTCTDNARDYAKMMSTLAAAKMQEGGSVDLTDVQRPGNMLKTLECDDECRVEARTRQLALALQIRNPDVSAKLAPRYNENLRATATKEPSFAQQIHDALTDLVQRAKKSKQKTRSHSFPSMNWQKRQFIHELCEHFGCESVAYDAEPNRNVVATADREKSWLPAMSVLEVVAREAGKRRVPGPVLRAPPAAAASASLASTTNTNKSGGGWATLTSSNAWAARSQPKQTPPEAKIDYFDNPPDN